MGVTGHRVLPADQLLTERVAEVLRGLRARCERGPATPVRLTAISALAEGADRLVARTVLAEGGRLEAVLPMPLASYLEDFGDERSRREFRALLEQAARITRGHQRPHTQEERESFYRAAGENLVARGDVLLALWNGEPSRGRGGTADIVAFARSLGKPLVWIKTEPPYEATEERLEYLPDPELLRAVRDFNRARLTSADVQEASARAEHDLLPATASPSPRLEALRQWIVPYYVRADLLASRYQSRFGWLSGAVYFLAFLAIVAALVQVLFASHSPLAATPEAAFLIAILLLVALERRAHLGSHDRWMVYRFLAERLRSAFFLAAADVEEGYDIEVAGGPLQETSARWLARTLAGVYAERPHLHAHVTELAAVSGLLRSAWLADQIDYHTRAEQRHERRHTRLTRALYVVFAATLVAVLCHLAGAAPEGSVGARVIILAAIGLPALGAALGGLRSHLQGEHHADRHREMRELLAQRRNELAPPRSLHDLRAQAVGIEEALLSESADWLRQISFSVLEPVA